MKRWVQHFLFVALSSVSSLSPATGTIGITPPTTFQMKCQMYLLDKGIMSPHRYAKLIFERLSSMGTVQVRELPAERDYRTWVNELHEKRIPVGEPQGPLNLPVYPTILETGGLPLGPDGRFAISLTLTASHNGPKEIHFAPHTLLFMGEVLSMMEQFPANFGRTGVVRNGQSGPLSALYRSEIVLDYLTRLQFEEGLPSPEPMAMTAEFEHFIAISMRPNEARFQVLRTLGEFWLQILLTRSERYGVATPTLAIETFLHITETNPFTQRHFDFSEVRGLASRIYGRIALPRIRRDLAHAMVPDSSELFGHYDVLTKSLLALAEEADESEGRPPRGSAFPGDYTFSPGDYALVQGVLTAYEQLFGKKPPIVYLIMEFLRAKQNGRKHDSRLLEALRETILSRLLTHQSLEAIIAKLEQTPDNPSWLELMVDSGYSREATIVTLENMAQQQR